MNFIIVEVLRISCLNIIIIIENLNGLFKYYYYY